MANEVKLGEQVNVATRSRMAVYRQKRKQHATEEKVANTDFPLLIDCASKEVMPQQQANQLLASVKWQPENDFEQGFKPFMEPVKINSKSYHVYYTDFVSDAEVKHDCELKQSEGRILSKLPWQQCRVCEQAQRLWHTDLKHVLQNGGTVIHPDMTFGQQVALGKC